MKYARVGFSREMVEIWETSRRGIEKIEMSEQGAKWLLAKVEVVLAKRGMLGFVGSRRRGGVNLQISVKENKNGRYLLMATIADGKIRFNAICIPRGRSFGGWERS